MLVPSISLALLLGSNAQTLAQPCASGIAFETPNVIALGGFGAVATCIADLNADLLNDVAVVSQDSDELSILISRGNGEFESPITYPTGSNPSSVAAGDFNEDGRPDIAVTNVGSDDVGIYIALSDGTLAAPTFFPTGAFPSDLVVGDVDNDGHLDIACSHYAQQYSVLSGFGDGGFDLPAVTTLPGAQAPWSIRSADLNADSNIDLLVGDSFGNTTFEILLGDGTGSFAPTSIAAGCCPWFIATCDLDIDGDVDVAVSTEREGILIYLNDGSGSLSVPSTLSVQSTSLLLGIEAAEVTGDSFPDLVVLFESNGKPPGFMVLPGLGDGSFGPQECFTSAAYDLAVGDFSGDGTPDVAAVDFSSAPSALWAAVNLSTSASPAEYCTAKVSSAGCLASVDSAGQAGFSEPGVFAVLAREIINNKPGLLFYGETGRLSVPFLGGTLCVQPPLTRTPPAISGGNPPPNDCSGTFSFDFNQWIQTFQDPSLAPGSQVDCQYWYRDPNQLDGTGAGLSNALEFWICP